MKIKSQAGFTLIEGLLILIAVTLIAGVGYYVFQAQNKANDNLNTANISSQSATPHTKKTANATNELTIKQLGIKLKRDPLLRGLSYSYSDSPNVKTALFHQAEFTKVVTACWTDDKLPGEPAVAFVERFEGTYDPSAEPKDVFADFAKQFKGFYIEYGHPDGGNCRTSDQAKLDATSKLFNQLDAPLKAAIQNAEAIQ